MKKPLLRLLGALACLLLLNACSTTPDRQSGNALFSTANDPVLLFPEAQEVAMGQQSAAEYKAKLPPAPAAVQAYVSALGRRLADASDRPGLPWAFHAVQSDEINAFALPGGEVFIYTGILKRFKDEAELAAVLGHEVGHVVKQHALKRIQRQMALQMGLDTLVGMLGQRQNAALVGQGASLAGSLLVLRNTRENELEADEQGMRLTAAVGLDPAAMVGVQEMLMSLAAGKPAGALDEMFSTHPLSENRISQARALLPGYAGPTARNAAAYRKAIAGLK